MESLVLYRQKPSAQKQKRKPRQQQPAQPLRRNLIPLAQSRQTAARPYQIQGGRNMIRVQHREMVAPISGTVGFGATPFTMSPSSLNFSWLNRLADCYEMYHWNSLAFTFEPAKSATSPGLIYMAPDYDISDPLPLGGSVISSYQDAVVGNIYAPLHCRVNPASLHRHHHDLFVGTVPPTSCDPHTYHPGFFVMATEACADTTMHGRLMVEYDITFSVPDNSPGCPIDDVAEEAVIQDTVNSTMTRANCWGTAGSEARKQGENLVNVPFGSSLRFVKRGIYIARLLIRYLNAWNAAPSTAASTATVQSITGGDGAFDGAKVGADGLDYRTISYLVQVTAPDQILATNFTGTFGADGDLQVVQANVTECNVRHVDGSLEA